MLDRPSDTASGVSFWLARHGRSAAAARRLLRTFLAATPGGGDFDWEADLLLSELVANAVTHARVPPGPLIRIRFGLEFGRLRIEVHDGSAVVPHAREVDRLDESGRGMHLVGALAEAWGVGPRADGPGKVVWATLAPRTDRHAPDSPSTTDGRDG
ncbi:ATP-binding protein [Kitasatospora sp. NPDC088346]|uniref:ATP-binding protein n=1 Tax=Kitasatospora sp. NPDC088346 TaxID=3364073 RepID=UPI003824CD44